MKKMFFVCTLLLVAMSICAQESEDPKKGDFNMGVTYGAGYSMMRMDDPSNPNGVANVQGGLAFDWWFANHFFVETSLTYQRRGWRMDFEKETDNYDIEWEQKSLLHYLEIPMTCSYWYRLKRIGMVYEVGPYVAIGLGGKQKSSFDLDIDDPDYFSEANAQLAVLKSKNREQKVFDNDDAKRFDFGLRFGLGMTYGKNMKFMVGYDLGLLDLYRGDNGLKSKNGTVYGAFTFYVK